ncbi:MAG: Antitoxin Phd YefM, type toxin-antitoxin system [Polyangiaceae bacterium]|jgi:prevent-host-death family protein|nr:Antitoxin Phd YefM, type toxin-antitoxin system [Polyangiaceae bacterium]
MKSLPIPVAQARSNFSDVLDDARKGKRIRLTRHGKAVGWIIGENEKRLLDAAPAGKKPKARRSSRSRG